MSWHDTKHAEPEPFKPDGIHWRDGAGRVVLIASLSDDHLRNILRMLYRRADIWSWAQAANPPLGEMACDAHADWCEELAEMTPTQLILVAGPTREIAPGLVAEWERRRYHVDTWRDDAFRNRLAMRMWDAAFGWMKKQPKVPPDARPDPVEGCDYIDCSVSGESTH